MTQTVILRQHNRALAHRLIDAAPDGHVCKVSPPKRTSDQNDKMWAMLSDVARAKPQGRNLPPEVWKCLFMSEAGFEARWEPSLDGQGVVHVGFKSSRLNKAQFSELIEAISAFGAEHGVQWSDPT
jgi:hypothetical protein